MNNLNVIFIGNNKLDVMPYFDRIEFEFEGKIKAEFANNPEEALEMIPKEGNFLVITEALIPHGFQLPAEYGTERTAGTIFLIEAAHQKNPECKIILNDSDFFDLEKEIKKERKFDCYINSLHKEAYDLLFRKIREYLKIRQLVN